MNRAHRLRGPGGERVVIVGGILGLEADAEILQSEFDRERPNSVLLGVPYEDLDAVRATKGKEAETEFASTDMDEAYLLRLSEFGLVKSPPPDLYRAYELAERFHLAVEAIDLGDEAFTERYTHHVGMLEVLRSNRNQRKLVAREFEVHSAEDFALQWDDAMFPTKGLQKVQEDREAHMVDRIQTLSRNAGLHLALLPLPRAIGVFDKLRDAGWRAESAP
ncbi:MAG TPA: hypothetical protein VI818_00900 [Candidatus Thermoplasmatota archaeon]|nr:hypothetical protein [Candidatus Thermoplasmatota archaeon]